MNIEGFQEKWFDLRIWELKITPTKHTDQMSYGANLVWQSPHKRAKPSEIVSIDNSENKRSKEQKRTTKTTPKQ